MSYDEGLAERLREALQSQRGISENTMFGGLAFMSRGYMFVGITGDILMARIGPDYYEQALSRPHVRVMDFTGKSSSTSPAGRSVRSLACSIAVALCRVNSGADGPVQISQPDSPGTRSTFSVVLLTG